jgi:hypothetical protein
MDNMRLDVASLVPNRMDRDAATYRTVRANRIGLGCMGRLERGDVRPV